MIIESELRDWCRDRAAHRRARLAAEALASLWNAGSEHAAFATAMASLESPTAESVAGAVRRLFEDEGWVEDLIGRLAAAMHDDPYFEPPFRNLNSGIHTGLVVYEDDFVSIAAGVMSVNALAQKRIGPRGPASITFTGQVDIFRFLKVGGATLSFWEAPMIGPDFTAAFAGACRRTGDRRIADGEILVVDGRRQSFVVEHAASNLVLLQASVKRDRAPVSAEFDCTTGEYVGCSAADDSASRIQMLTTLLRKLDYDTAFPAIADFLSHPNFFVRWHVMRELLGLDAEAALPHLRRMAAGDAHAENRRAARTVLDRLESGTGAGRKAA
jgi:hypothetical protein